MFFLLFVTLLVNLLAAPSRSGQPDIGSIEQVAWRADGAYIAAAGNTHLAVYTPELELIASTALEFSTHELEWWGSRLIATGPARTDGDSVHPDTYTAFVFDFADNGLTRRFTIRSLTPVTFDVFADSTHIGVTSQRGWTVINAQLAEQRHFDGVVAAEPSPDKTQFALVWPDSIRVVDVTTCCSDKTFDAIDGTFHAAAWGADGLELAGLERHRVTVWDLETGAQRMTFSRRIEATSWETPQERYVDVEPSGALSVEGREWIVMADLPRTPGFSMLHLWSSDGTAIEHKKQFSLHSAIRLRPDRVLVKGTSQQGDAFWLALDTDTGELLETELLEAQIWLNPVLPQIVTARIDSRAFRLLDRDSLTPLGEFEIDARLTYSIDFSPDGLRFVSAHGHDGLRIRDIATGQIIASTAH